MDAPLQRRIQRYGWDKAAGFYEQFWAGQLKVVQDRLLELARLRPGERVLDVASGTGLVTLPAATVVGETGHVVATDISDEMVRTLEHQAAQAGVTGTFRRMDAEALALPDAAFDVALCSLGLMYVPDWQRALDEMHRVVVPGGRAVASVWGARSNCGWAEIFPIVERRVHSDVCPLFFTPGTGDTLPGAFAAAGFVDVGVERLSTILHYDSEEEAVGAAFVGGPVALAHSRFDERTRASAYEEYLESIRPWRHGDAFDVPGEFVVAWGRKAIGDGR